MKRIYFVIVAILSNILFVAAQNIFPSTGSTGIGTSTPNASSILEIKSTTKGMLVPRMTKAQRDLIATPATGLFIYQTNSTPGFYYYSGTAWTALASQWTTAGNSIYFNNKVGLGTSTPNAKFSISRTGNALYGTAMSNTFSTMSGTLGNNVGDTICLASFGFNSANQSALSFRGYRTINTGTDWTTTSIGITMDVDNTFQAGAGIWLNSNGNVGINSANPLARLHVIAPINGQSGILVSDPGNGYAFESFISSPNGAGMHLINSNASQALPLMLIGSQKGEAIYASTNNPSAYAAHFVGDVYTSGLYQSSDEKLKKNVKSFTGALNAIKKMEVKSYDFRSDGVIGKMNLPRQTQVGIMAQNIEQVFPQLVKEDVFDASYQDNTMKPGTGEKMNFKAVNYTGLIPVLVQAVQELTQQNENMQKQIDDLKIMMLAGNKANVSLDLKEKSNPINLTETSLEQNSPNPFAGTTTIHYTLPQTYTSAKIIITHKSGKVLKQITLSGNGKGAVNIDAAILSSGAYHYSLYVDGKLIGTKQMILTK